MCNSAVHRQFNMITEPFPFSTFQFLRTCNRLILPTDVRQYYTVAKDKSFECLPGTSISESKTLPQLTTTKSIEIPPNPDSTPIFTSSSASYPKDITSTAIPPLLASNPSACLPETFDFASDFTAPQTHLPSLNYSNLFNRRQRGEKRPIPDEQKDEKYFERRKRNNEAAKKSRDARKLREDRVAFRAAILEHENAILRAQLVALRDEMTTLRQMIGPRATQISLNL
ncbi:D site-binding protein isoform X1 [Hermetia illucens]|uniref:D site-binding protein isoform X1 n=1 Tax=Hermetia illucens TaxID=343691 RepID=UPI0018CC7604|nr:D site-binding protein isoform X1 [Hermetia illucens]